MLLMFSVFVFVVAVDQGSKAFVASRLQEGTATLGNVFGMRLRHVVNRRRPWGSPVGVRVMTIAWLILIAAGCVSASIVHNTAGYIAVGTIMAAITVRTRFAELMLPLLVLPFLLPPVSWAVQVTARLLTGRPANEIVGWLRLLGLYDVVFVTVCLLLFPPLMDE